MRPKAVWEPEFHRIFVDLCIEQKLEGNKPTTHFTKDGWRNILESFQEKTGVKYDRMQLKNHWDTMGRQWKIWQRLIQCDYMKWEPESNTFGASDEDWTNYLQANPEAGLYRGSPPQYLDKLEMIFEGNSVDMKDEEASGTQKRRSSSSRHEEYSNGDEDRQIMSASLTPQTKGYWSPSTHELFVDLLMQEALKGNRPDTHFTKEGWKTILETINEKTGIGYTRAQLKNHWDCTRKSWKIWCHLIGASIMKWDPNSRTFGASEEDWQNYLRVNPRASQFRNKQIHHPDKLAIIFRGIIEPGEIYSPTPRRKRRSVYAETSQLHEPIPLSVMHMNETVTTSPYGEGISPSLHLKLNPSYAESQLQEDEAAPIDRSNVTTANESPASVQMVSGKAQYSIGECIERLDAMEEVEQGSDLYLFALDLFLKQEYREIFLQLKKPSLRVVWLQRLLLSGGPTIT